MNLENVGGREDRQGNGSKGETNVELRVEDTAAYKEILRINCETFEDKLTAIGSVITKTADQKILMNYHTHGQTRKTTMRL